MTKTASHAALILTPARKMSGTCNPEVAAVQQAVQENFTCSAKQISLELEPGTFVPDQKDAPDCMLS